MRFRAVMALIVNSSSFCDAVQSCMFGRTEFPSCSELNSKLFRQQTAWSQIYICFSIIQKMKAANGVSAIQKIIYVSVDLRGLLFPFEVEWNLVHCYWGRYWSIVPTSDDGWWWRWWWVWSSRRNDWQGNPKHSEKTCPSAALFITNPIWPDPASNPGSRWETGDQPPKLRHGKTRYYVRRRTAVIGVMGN
jgi:hypothetical protein